MNEFPKLYKKNKDGKVTGDGRRSNCRKCENLRRKNSYYKNPITRMLMNAKTRARTLNLDFNITHEDVPIPKKCPILEIEFIQGTKGNYSFTPTIDRIIPSKGYIKGNVKVISMLANKMKNSATREECVKFAKNIIKYYDDIV